jgi:hypothetical protein
MNRVLLAVIPAIAAIVIGASALITSPIACGCEDAHMLLAEEAGLDSSKPNIYSAKQIEAGLNIHLVGHVRVPHELGLLAPEVDLCKHLTRTVADFFVPMSESWLLQKGFQIRLVTTPSGIVQQIHVEQHWRSSP